MAYQEGQRLQGSDGKIYVVQGGVPREDMGASTPAPAAPAGPPAFIPGVPKQEKPKTYEPPSGYTGGPGGLSPIPGGPADPNAPQNQPKPAQPKAADASKAAARRANLDSLVEQINRVQELYESNIAPEALGPVSSLGDYLPTPENRQFDTAAAGMAEQGLAAFRVPGVGAQSDAELRQFVQANKPDASDYDASIEEKLSQLRRRVDANRAALGLPPAQWTGAESQDDIAAVAAQSETPPSIPGAGDAAGPLAPAGDGQQTDDPTLAGIRGQYKAMLQAKEAPGKIVQWLRSMGITNPGVLRSAAQQAQHRIKTNTPVDQYNTAELDDTYVPLSASDQMLNSAGQSAPGAYAVGAANFLTGNNLDSMAGAMGGNAERTRMGMNALSEQFPTATAAGEISGGVMGGMTGEAGLARLGMASGFGRAVAADSAFGALNGAGMADGGNRALGAFTGAATSAAGNVAGTGAARGISRAIGPTGGGMNALYDAGVRPTLGQRVADKGVVGRAVNATEEALQSVPLVGAAVQGARQEARDQFQVGAFNEALKEVGEQLPKGMKPGNAPHAYAQKTFERVYAEARNGMRLVGDEELTNELAELSQQVATLAEPSQRRFQSLMKNVVTRRAAGGELAGEAYKKVHSDLGKQIRAIRNNPSGDYELADALGDLQNTLDNAARRHSDPEAVALLDAADAGYARLVRIEEAAKSRGGGSGEFTPTQFDRSVQKTSGGTRSKAYLRGDALMQDYAEQGMGLVDRMPNSGTTDRALAATTVAGGAAYLEPSTLGFLAAVGAAYAPGGRKVMQKAIAPAGPRRQAIAQQLRKRARLVGATTAASAVSALPGTAHGQ